MTSPNLSETTQRAVTARVKMTMLGGPGSGNWGHKGRPGKRGGSAASTGGGAASAAPTQKIQLSPASRSIVDSCTDNILPAQNLLEELNLAVEEDDNDMIQEISGRLDDIVWNAVEDANRAKKDGTPLVKSIGEATRNAAFHIYQAIEGAKIGDGNDVFRNASGASEWIDRVNSLASQVRGS